jgi:nucleoside-diphosphate-sugar epimerase
MGEILITGGAGNFGRHLAMALREEGHSLRILDLPACDFGFFDGWERTRIFAGDILDGSMVRGALEGASWVFHLAAVLPPASERDRDRTFRVNVEGTRSILDGCGAVPGTRRLVLASSVSVYGDTSGTKYPIGPNHPVNPNDWYAESKAVSERMVTASGVPYTNLRISGVVIPEFLDPPEPWPFVPTQRIELVSLSDVIAALVSLTRTEGGLNESLIIAGGPTWQITGESYVRRWAEVMEIPYDAMLFPQRLGWLNWYDTGRSQTLLGYQNTPLEAFFSQLKVAVDEALA